MMLNNVRKCNHLLYYFDDYRGFGIYRKSDLATGTLPCYNGSVDLGRSSFRVDDYERLYGRRNQHE